MYIIRYFSHFFLFPIFEISNLGKSKSEQVTYLILTSSESVKSGADRDEKPNFVSLFGNKSLSLYHNSKQNEHQQTKSSVDRRSISLFGCAAIQSSAEEIRKEYFSNKKK